MNRHHTYCHVLLLNVFSASGFCVWTNVNADTAVFFLFCFCYVLWKMQNKPGSDWCWGRKVDVLQAVSWRWRGAAGMIGGAGEQITLLGCDWPGRVDRCTWDDLQDLLYRKPAFIDLRLVRAMVKHSVKKIQNKWEEKEQDSFSEPKIHRFTF